jgi:hypothetical protein
MMATGNELAQAVVGNSDVYVDEELYFRPDHQKRTIDCVPQYRCHSSTSFFFSVTRVIFGYDSSSRHEIVPQNRTCLFQFSFLTDTA